MLDHVGSPMGWGPWVIGRSDMMHGMFDICTIHPNNDPFNGPLWFIQSSPFLSIRCD